MHLLLGALCVGPVSRAPRLLWVAAMVVVTALMSQLAPAWVAYWLVELLSCPVRCPGTFHGASRTLHVMAGTWNQDPQ